MKRVKKISIFGLAGYNTGDTAIAKSIDLLFHECVYKEKECKKRLEWKISTVRKSALKSLGLKEFSLKKKSFIGLYNIYRTIKESDEVFIGGGSLIQDMLGGFVFKGVIGHSFIISLICVLTRTNYSFLCIGIDDLKRKVNRYVALFCLKRAKSIYVRDELSQENAKKYSKRNANIIRDPAFILNVKINKGKEKNILNKYNISLADRYIVISLVKEVFSKKDNFLRAEALVSIFAQKEDLDKIILLSMDSRYNDELEIYHQVKRKIKSPKIEIISETSPQETVVLLHNSSFNILTRLHCMILGINKVPFHLISRTTKTKALIDFLKIPNNLVSQINEYSPKEIYKTYIDSLEHTKKFNYSRDIEKIQLSIRQKFSSIYIFNDND